MADRRTWMFRLMLAAGPLAGLPAAAQMPDPAITSDTPEYCGLLVSRLGLMGHAPWPDDVAALRAEGARLCGHGHVRSGILRLRRAIAILRHPGG